MFKVFVRYPTFDEERQIAKRTTSIQSDDIKKVLDAAEILGGGRIIWRHLALWTCPVATIWSCSLPRVGAALSSRQGESTSRGAMTNPSPRPSGAGPLQSRTRDCSPHQAGISEVAAGSSVSSSTVLAGDILSAFASAITGIGQTDPRSSRS